MENLQVSNVQQSPGKTNQVSTRYESGIYKVHTGYLGLVLGTYRIHSGYSQSESIDVTMLQCYRYYSCKVNMAHTKYQLGMYWVFIG